MKMKRIIIIFLYCMIKALAFGQSKEIMDVQMYNVIDRKGQVVFSFMGTSYGERDFQYLLDPDSGEYILKGSGRRVRIPDKSSIWAMTNDQSCFVIQTHDNTFGVIDDCGRTLVDFGKYERIEHYRDDLFFARIKGNYWGVINNKDRIVVPFLYSRFYTRQCTGFRNRLLQLL